MTRHSALLGLLLAIISTAAGGQMRPSQAGQPGMQQTGQAPGSSTPGQSDNTNRAADELGTNPSDLAGQIETAIRDDPTLANDQISVTVTDTDILLSGTVRSGKEKETARRIAESFAINRKVVDKVKVSTSKNTRSDQPRPN
jgi:osmotically-inducible protein OsmY